MFIDCFTSKKGGGHLLGSVHLLRTIRYYYLPIIIFSELLTLHQYSLLIIYDVEIPKKIIHSGLLEAKGKIINICLISVML